VLHTLAPDSSSPPTETPSSQNVVSLTGKLSGVLRIESSAGILVATWPDKQEMAVETTVSAYSLLSSRDADCQGVWESIMETEHEVPLPTSMIISHSQLPRVPSLPSKKLLHLPQAALSKRNEAVSNNSTNSIVPPVKHIVGQARDKSTHVRILLPMLLVCPESFSINFEKIR